MIGVVILDQAGYSIKAINEVARRMLGRDRERLVGRDFLKFAGARGRTALIDSLTRAADAPGSPISGECELIGHPRHSVRVQLTIHPTRTGTDTGELFLALHDITRLRMLEEAARRNEERFRLIANDSVETAFFHDPELKYIWITKAFASFSVADILGRTDRQLLGGEVGEDLSRFKESVLTERRERQTEVVVPQPDGELLSYLVVCRPRTRLDGQVVGLSGFMRNVTEQKKAEAELAEREAQLRRERSNLEELNAAFKLLLKHRDEEREQQQDDLLNRINNYILPHFQRLKRTGLDKPQTDLVEMIESALLAHLPGGGSRSLTGSLPGFTPREIEIANLIVLGKSSEEIAELIRVSTQTVSFHRKNIRRKLGLTGRSQNLRAFLMSLQK